MKSSRGTVRWEDCAIRRKIPSELLARPAPVQCPITRRAGRRQGTHVPSFSLAPIISVMRRTFVERIASLFDFLQHDDLAGEF